MLIPLAISPSHVNPDCRGANNAVASIHLKFAHQTPLLTDVCPALSGEDAARPLRNASHRHSPIAVDSNRTSCTLAKAPDTRFQAPLAFAGEFLKIDPIITGYRAQNTFRTQRRANRASRLTSKRRLSGVRAKYQHEWGLQICVNAPMRRRENRSSNLCRYLALTPLARPPRSRARRRRCCADSKL
jgi:hypothetical protein